MTTQESLLALAQAVYPDREWKLQRGRPAYSPYGSSYHKQFHPAGEHNMRVLCWLLGRIRVEITHREVVCWHSNDIMLCAIEHDNTPATLADAIVQAACRVVGG